MELLSSEVGFYELLSLTTISSSLLMYLMGIDGIIKATKFKAEEISIFPFLFCTITSTFSLKYGMLLNDSAMIIVNGFGAITEAAYTLVLYNLYHQKVKAYINLFFEKVSSLKTVCNTSSALKCNRTVGL